jgi:hypothetical protein
MALLKLVTGATWPLSGTADASSTGLSALSGVAFTHVGSTDVPAGSNATGYIRQDSAGLSYIYPDAAATMFTAGDRYTSRIWLRANLEVSPPVDASAIVLRDFNGYGLRVIQYLYYNATVGGWNCFASSFSGGGTVQNFLLQGSSGSPAIIRPGRWYEFIAEINAASGAGDYCFYVNGRIVSRVTGITGATGGTASPSDVYQKWTVGVAGCKFDVTGPIASDNGTDVAIARVDRDLKTSDLTTDIFDISFLTATRGKDWSVTLDTSTMVETSYGTSGIAPIRRRQVLSSAGTADFKTSRDLGTLPYNGSGWCTLAFPMTYLPGSSVMEIALRNTDDDADIVTLEVDSTALVQGSVEVGTWDHAKRYAILLHLADSGEAAATLIDLTTFDGVTPISFSARLANWTPQEVGRVEQRVTVDSSAEIEGFVASRYCDLFAVDSMTTAEANTISPAFYISRCNVGAYWDTWYSDEVCVPNHFSHRSDRPYSVFCIAVGRPGVGTEWFNTVVLPGLRHSKAIRLVRIDGGSINDLSGVNDSNRAEKLALWKSRFDESVFDLVNRGNRVWLMTMIRREQGTYTATQNREIDAMNGHIRTVAQLAQKYSGGDRLVDFSDIAYSVDDHSSLFTAGDDIHFDTAGEILVAGLALTIKTQSFAAVPIQELTAGIVEDGVDNSTTATNAATAAAEILKIPRAPTTLTAGGEHYLNIAGGDNNGGQSGLVTISTTVPPAE